jgi:hypothetical protein
MPSSKQPTHGLKGSARDVGMKALPPIPQYERDGKFEHRVGSKDELFDWNAELDSAGAEGAEKQALWELYNHEGGQKMDGTSKAGITQATLDGLQKLDHQETKKSFEKIGIKPGMKPNDLTMKQQVEAHRLHMDDTMRAAGKGLGVPGRKVPNHIGDERIATAISDTLTREGGPKGVPIIQKAVNRYRESIGRKDKLDVDRAFGSQTFGGVRDIVKSGPKARETFMGLLAVERKAHRQKENPEIYKGDVARIDYYLRRR